MPRGRLPADDSLVEAARLGAEHFVSLASPSHLAAGALAVPRRIPWKPDLDDLTWNWCHGPAGSLELFVALAAAGVTSVAGDPPAVWLSRCLRPCAPRASPSAGTPASGTTTAAAAAPPASAPPCCPTTPPSRCVLADALVERAYVEGDRAYWRFTEHRNPEPLLPPGVGWMQGAAGIAGFLFEVAACAA